MTGLYENIYSIQNDPALTFLLRSPKLQIEPLSLTSIKRQYSRVFDIPEDEAVKLAELTKGYAFAFQALGLLYYEYREKMTMGEILTKFDELLEDFVYRKIWQGLSEQDKQVILAMTDAPVKTSEMCKRLSMTSSIYSKYRDRLKKRGILSSPKYGFVEPALPRFLEVVRGL